MADDLNIPDRPRTPLERCLLDWGAAHLPEATDSIVERWGDWEWERRCLGAIFRKAARQSPRWLIMVATNYPRDVIKLGPYIRQVKMPWGDVPPPRLTWQQWVESAWI